MGVAKFDRDDFIEWDNSKNYATEKRLQSRIQTLAVDLSAHLGNHDVWAKKSTEITLA